MTDLKHQEWARRVHEVVSACRQERPTYDFLDEILGPDADRFLDVVRSCLPRPADILTYVGTLKSELDVVVVLLALTDELRPHAVQHVLFDALYVLWRFGGSRVGARAIVEGQVVLRTGQSAHVGLVHLKLGLLERAAGSGLAAKHFEAALEAGTPLPKGVPGSLAQVQASETPWRTYAGVRSVSITPATHRDFADPIGGEWHGTFDLAESDPGPLQMFSIQHGVISVDTSGGRPCFYVFDEEGTFIPTLSAGDDPFIVEIQDVEGCAALIDDWHGGFNVCHAMFDKMTRLGVYHRDRPNERLKVITFTDAPWYRQALASMGHEHVSPGTARWSFRAEQLLMLSNHRRGEVLHPAFSGGEHAISFITEQWQARIPGKRRIYISREDAGNRRIKNEDEVQACFRSHGFEIHVLSHLTFEKQKSLFQDASHIASIHGAGLAN